MYTLPFFNEIYTHYVYTACCIHSVCVSMIFFDKKQNSEYYTVPYVENQKKSKSKFCNPHTSLFFSIIESAAAILYIIVIAYILYIIHVSEYKSYHHFLETTSLLLLLLLLLLLYCCWYTILALITTQN